jgi:hypothetical protein
VRPCFEKKKKILKQLIVLKFFLEVLFEFPKL